MFPLPNSLYNVRQPFPHISCETVDLFATKVLYSLERHLQCSECYISFEKCCTPLLHECVDPFKPHPPS